MAKKLPKGWIHTMEKLVIEGLRRLSGAVTVHGAKNSVLPILAAAFLARGETTLCNCPALSDVRASCAILRHLGCMVDTDGDCISVNTDGVCRGDIPHELMLQMRSSIIFLGAIAARTGGAQMSFPGGCELGPRPIDLHIGALRKLGVNIEETRGRLVCRVDGRLKGADIALSFPSVGATENVLIAASVAEGTTTLTGAACEPEIVDLCRYLNACGAKIAGAGEGTIVIEGVEKLHGCEHRVIPDRIEAATYMAAAAVTGGSLILKQVYPPHLKAVIPVFEEAGCHISTWEDELLITAPARLRSIKTVRTMPYPGFPTDAAAPVMAMACVADGCSVFIENIFQNRYKHVGELLRLGAHIKTEGRVAVVEGVPMLSGAQVCCTDLRGGAALVVAGLAADGETAVERIEHIDRGYQHIEKTLSAVGACVRRVRE